MAALPDYQTPDPAAAADDAAERPANQPAERPADPSADQPADHRLYLTDPATTRIEAKKSSEKGYCYHRFPGDEHFHILMGGELYVARGDQRICLECALRLGYLTANRLHWQTRERRVKKPAV